MFIRLTIQNNIFSLTLSVSLRRWLCDLWAFKVWTCDNLWSHLVNVSNCVLLEKYFYQIFVSSCCCGCCCWCLLACFYRATSSSETVGIQLVAVLGLNLWWKKCTGGKKKNISFSLSLFLSLQPHPKIHFSSHLFSYQSPKRSLFDASMSLLLTSLLFTRKSFFPFFIFRHNFFLRHNFEFPFAQKSCCFGSTRDLSW